MRLVIKFIWALRAISLFVITFFALDAMLGAVVEMRGGSDYIKPFHTWNMVFCSFVTVVIIEITYRFFGAMHRFPWLMQWLGFIHVVIVVTFFALPLGDRFAIRHERALGPPMSGDMGYGWYYWDDSGMGGDPITGIYLLFFLSQPLKLSCFFLGSALVIALASRARKKDPGGHAISSNDW